MREVVVAKPVGTERGSKPFRLETDQGYWTAVWAGGGIAGLALLIAVYYWFKIFIGESYHDAQYLLTFLVMTAVGGLLILVLVLVHELRRVTQALLGNRL